MGGDGLATMAVTEWWPWLEDAGGSLPFSQWPGWALRPFLAHVQHLWAQLAPVDSLYTLSPGRPLSRRRVRTWRLLAFAARVSPDLTTSLLTVCDWRLGDTRDVLDSQLLQLGQALITQPASNCRAAFTSWNLTSLTDFWTTEALAKRSVLARCLDQGPVCLQETKWQPHHACELERLYPGLVVCHSPAQPTEAGGYSGGVAILLPTGLNFHLTQAFELLPGFAILAHISTPSGLSSTWNPSPTPPYCSRGGPGTPPPDRPTVPASGRLEHTTRPG